MTRIRSSVQLKLEHNVEQHVPGEFDDEKQGKRKEKAKEKKRRIRTLGIFKANLPPSIADSHSFLISFPQSSASGAVILRPFPFSNYEI